MRSVSLSLPENSLLLLLPSGVRSQWVRRLIYLWRRNLAQALDRLAPRTPKQVIELLRLQGRTYREARNTPLAELTPDELEALGLLAEELQHTGLRASTLLASLHHPEDDV